MGFAHVQASPLTRSSYHAREAAGLGRPSVAVAVAVAGAVSVTAGGAAARSRGRRLARVRERMGEPGVDVLLLSLGADLPWLTGYEAMPLERLTMLVLPADGEPVLVVPGLEAPRVRRRRRPVRPAPMVGRPRTRSALVVGPGRSARAARSAISDRAWATSLLALQATLPDAAWVRRPRR